MKNKNNFKLIRHKTKQFFKINQIQDMKLRINYCNNNLRILEILQNGRITSR